MRWNYPLALVALLGAIAVIPARAAVVARVGAAAQASYDSSGVAVFIHIKGGGMLEASVGGQQFDYEPGLE
jgi:hypothetical protein